MKITENDNTITATETLKFKDFSPKEQERFFDMIWKDGLTLEEAYEKMAEIMMDTILVPFKEKMIFYIIVFLICIWTKKRKRK